MLLWGNRPGARADMHQVLWELQAEHVLGCPLVVSYLNFSGLCELDIQAGLSLQGCWKLGLEPSLSSCGLLPRV